MTEAGRPDAGFILTDLERDALTEIVNIGMGRAAKNLSLLVKEQVQLSIPHTEIMSRAGVSGILSNRERSGLVAIGQDFQGVFSGQALLIFPEANSLELVRAIVEKNLAIEEIVDLEQEALAEVGNIILNGCLVVIANMLKHGLTMSLPQVIRGDSHRILLGRQDTLPGELVLFLTIDFSVRARNINGYLALLMDLPSLSELRRLIQEFIGRIEEGSAKA
jgi:chemotaxis protein CheC